MIAYDAIIVGAGFAGLSAAARLAQDGARVLVLEARARLGGRATAFRDRDTGELVDNGQHVLLGCYRETFAFLDLIGAAANVRRQRDLAVTMIARDGVASRLRCRQLPAPWHLVSGIVGWSALGWRDRLSALRMAGPLRSARRMVDGAGGDDGGSSRLRDRTVTAWLTEHGQSARLREFLWDPLALAALNQSPDTASADPFARVLGEMFGADPAAAAIVLPTRPLHEMYAEPARSFIEQRGGLVRTGARARIRIDGHAGPTVIAGDEHWQAPAVISAIPWFALAELFEGDTEPLAGILDAAQRTEASPIVTVNLWFDRVVLDEPFVGLPGRLLQWVFDKRAVFGASASHLSLVSSGAQAVVAWTNPQFVDAALAEVRDALPRAREATLLRATVIREPRATFSLAPGQPARPATRTPVPGLYLAGDWIATALPATIEAAVRSGHRAAEAARPTCAP